MNQRLCDVFSPALCLKKYSDSDYALFEKDFSNSLPITRLQKNLEFEFQNKKLLLSALTHSSFSHEFSRFPLEDNERLEFLGDALLSALVAKVMIEREEFAMWPEGKLSSLRCKLVNEASLANLARSLGLEDTILLGMGAGAKRPGLSLQDGILCDALEALIAAIYLDTSFDKMCDLFKDKIFQNYNPSSVSLIEDDLLDPMNKLQEITMKRYKTLPEYRAREVVVDGAEKEFEVSVLVLGKLLASTRSVSKKKAKKDLASYVLKEKLYLVGEDGDVN